MPDAGTGWERDKRTHFDEIILNYDKIRPSYPDELVNSVLSYASSAEGRKAVEIGPGTGKATAPFLAAGYDVTAVEAGSGMAEFLTHRFQGSANFRVIVSTFEDAALQEDSCDLVYAASAFHWVDAKIGCPKAFRLLKSGGAVALLRYNAVPTCGDALYDEIQAAYDRHYYTHYKSNVKPVRKAKTDFMKPSENLIGYGFESLSDYGFCDVTMELCDVRLTYSADEYITLLDTLADHRGLPDDSRAALYGEVRKAIQSHGGSHSVDHVFQAYMGRKRR